MSVDDVRFTELYRQFYSRVLAYALRRIDPDQARDVVDETFLIAWRRLADVPSPALPWLLVTARNVLADQRRSGERNAAIARELQLCHGELSRTGMEGAAEDIVVERLAVLTALDELPDHDREALILTVWDGLSSREAARHLGCSTATFAVRLHRARRRLATALERQDAARSQSVSSGLDRVEVTATVRGDGDAVRGKDQ